MTAVSGTFASTGVGTGVSVKGQFNITLSSPGTFDAVCIPERSFDKGVTYVPFTYVDGSAITWKAALSTPLDEAEDGVLWRVRCTVFNSGPINWRISQ